MDNIPELFWTSYVSVPFLLFYFTFVFLFLFLFVCGFCFGGGVGGEEQTVGDELIHSRGLVGSYPLFHY